MDIVLNEYNAIQVDPVYHTAGDLNIDDMAT
jgi:hypothetical protein